MNYGCWCNFGHNAGYVGHGAGKPVDGLDQLCKNLHDGYKCAAIDAELEDGE